MAVYVDCMLQASAVDCSILVVVEEWRGGEKRGEERRGEERRGPTACTPISTRIRYCACMLTYV
jgi:hypothetical protein